jgi:hypothetical protein
MTSVTIMTNRQIKDIKKPAISRFFYVFNINNQKDGTSERTRTATPEETRF